MCTAATHNSCCDLVAKIMPMCSTAVSGPSTTGRGAVTFCTRALERCSPGYHQNLLEQSTLYCTIYQLSAEVSHVYGGNIYL